MSWNIQSICFLAGILLVFTLVLVYLLLTGLHKSDTKKHNLSRRAKKKALSDERGAGCTGNCNNCSGCGK